MFTIAHNGDTLKTFREKRGQRQNVAQIKSMLALTCYLKVTRGPLNGQPKYGRPKRAAVKYAQQKNKQTVQPVLYIVTVKKNTSLVVFLSL